MSDQILESVLGGYDKKCVLAKTDAYNSLLMMIEEGMISDAVINAELLKIRRMPMKKAKLLFFPVQGFSVSQTDSYFARLEREIADKIML